ncbi:phosphate ABC transporter substrate-binding protein [Vibrio palustris]|uniref:Phosphate-binding protein PstS 1 n=1 Tax=Vibrio palustris TaxID=1918946 RepID=A0A1R4B4Y4_9VIBR|nr:phosphate ABC transporter substrate-binding protein [Vibrio palustris]SJL83975.1 Phosphate-binding protein PstS 1 precursor [Vibrio palustris]
MLRLCFTTLAVILSFTSSAVAQQDIHISGSTSVAEVVELLAENFEKHNPDTFISVQGINSLSGITMLKKGVADIALSSHYLTQTEQESTLKVETMAIDGLVMIANIKNPVTNLSRRELFDIYRGNITNWKQLGGPNRPIAVITREPTSDSRNSFETLIGLIKVINEHQVSTITSNALVVNSSAMMKSLVHHNEQAIGYISSGAVDHSINAMTIDHIASTPNNIAKRDYPLARPFLLMHYPQQDSKQITAFLEYTHSADAKQILAQYGYQKMAEAK